MIPTIGVMLAVYAIARLLHVPLEAATDFKKRWIVLLLISIPAILLIAWLAIDLIQTSARQPQTNPFGQYR